MKRICVFCGSNSGIRTEYRKAAKKLGQILVSKNFGLVYGGASVGIMAVVADTVLAKGGEVIGVMPQFLVEKEVAHKNLSDLRIVDSMHARKLLMAELSDGFIAMPGGFGTFDEFFEVLTWGQLRMHNKPCGILNTCQYYSHLLNFLDYAVTEKFIGPPHRSMILVDENPQTLLEKFETYQPPDVKKWLDARNDSLLNPI
ncbi:MAG: TIGR00730 family Rossman fold protein [Desulfobacteraceae bacterium]|jgi:uncharacterized protein (TIGR00730 family)